MQEPPGEESEVNQEDQLHLEGFDCWQLQLKLLISHSLSETRKLRESEGEQIKAK